MKQKRHNTIVSVINSGAIRNQRELTAMLKSRGFDVTQATVSRDIKELHIIKCRMDDGGYRYVQAGGKNYPRGTDRIRLIFSNSVISIESALNQIVIKTLSGMAQAAAITLETMDWPEVLGTVGGDDTVLVVVRSADEAVRLTDKLNAIIDK